MDVQSPITQIRRLWTSLSVRQRIAILIAALTVAGGVTAFSWWRREQNFRPLYTAMDTEDAGAVVARLKETGAEYRVGSGGTSVLVPSDRVAETRLTMAAAGLPKSGRIGFELFDNTNLGTTDFAEQVNFRRALEGELERSIRSIAEVEQARVHLTFAKQSVFIESRMPAKASVLLRLRSGGQLAPANVTAITHLVASAVDGLETSAVSVMDADGNLLSRPKSALAGSEASDELIEYRQKLEKDLLAKANATLEPLVGAGRYRTSVSVDCDFSSGEQSDEVYDPEKSVMLSSQKTEETNTTAASGGVPGTASNLPRPAPRSTSVGGSVSRRTENVAYQSSRMVRRVKLPQGAIRRISASVLLDQASRWEHQDGRMQQVLTPPSPESIRVIREVVSAAVGLNVSRGDQLVVESLPFESTRQSKPPALHSAQPVTAPPSGFSLPQWDWRIWAAVGGGALLLILVAAVILRRKRKARRKRAVELQQAAAIASANAAGALPGATAPVPIADPKAAKALAQAQERVTQTARIETLAQDVRTAIAQDPALAARVLRSWLEEADA